MVAPVPAHIAKPLRRKLSCPSRRSGPNSRPVNLLQPLSSLFAAAVLCFQQLAASFHKTPGWGVPRRNLRDLCVSLPRSPRASRGALRGALSFVFALVCSSWRLLRPTPTTFRINTCKSVSKQTTLTTFRMNTYEKTGGGGTRHFRLSSVSLQFPASRTICATWRLCPLWPHSIAHPSRRHGGVPFLCTTHDSPHYSLPQFEA